MIENAFRIRPYIRPKKEKSVKESGILTWNNFLKSGYIQGLSNDRKIFAILMLKKLKIFSIASFITYW